jgi:hypothetical protein
VRRARAPDFRSLAYSNLSGVIGSALMRLPVVWRTAFAIAAGMTHLHLDELRAVCQ